MSLSPTQQEPSPQAIISAQALTQAAQVLRAAIYLAVASLCLLIYDTVITFDQEIKFVWCQRWSFGKATYIFIRYATISLMIVHVVSMLMFNPPQSLCHKMEELFVWSEVVVLIAGSSVLVVRTWLLWGGKKWVLASLIIGLAISSVLAILFVYADISDFRVISNPAPRILPGCIVRIPSTSWRPFVFPVLYETLIVVLTVIKVGATRTRAPVVMRLFLDGTLYYIVVVAVLLATTVGAAHPATRPIFVGSGFHTSCVSVGCSRLFLSLHAWSDEHKHRLGSTQSSLNANKHKISYQSHSSSGSSSRQPQPEYEYELTTRIPVVDVESGLGRVPLNTISSNSSSTVPLLPLQTAAPKAQMHSMLPEIERPALPERMWIVQSRHQQRSSRPPRSSSLYTPAAGTGKSNLGHQNSESMERASPAALQVTEELELEMGSEQGSASGPRAADTRKRHDVI